jgi:prevent-host-death family protein
VAAKVRKNDKRRLIRVPLSEIKNHFSEYIKRSKKDDLVITVHGKPVAVLVGFEIEDEDDLVDYQLLNNEEFKRKIAKSREQFQRGEYLTIEEVRAGL